MGLDYGMRVWCAIQLHNVGMEQWEENKQISTMQNVFYAVAVALDCKRSRG